jgi:hypothetical protein
VVWRLIFELLILVVVAWLVFVVGAALRRMLHALRLMGATPGRFEPGSEDPNRSLRSVGGSLEDAGQRTDMSLGSTERILYDIRETLRRA